MLPFNGVYSPLNLSRKEKLRVSQGLARKHGFFLDLRISDHFGTRIEKMFADSKKPGNFHFFFVIVH